MANSHTRPAVTACGARTGPGRPDRHVARPLRKSTLFINALGAAGMSATAALQPFEPHLAVRGVDAVARDNYRYRE